MNTRPPLPTLTPTGSEAPRRPADFLQPLARRVDQRPMTGQPTAAVPAAEKEQRRLTVARGITLTGAVKGCARLVVEGRVEAELEDCEALEVADHGFFRGEATVEQAEIRGNLSGQLTVRGRLVIRGSGRVTGHVRYQDLHIEPGGRLSGQIETLEELGAGAEAAGETPRFVFAAAEEPVRTALTPLELTESAEGSDPIAGSGGS